MRDFANHDGLTFKKAATSSGVSTLDRSSGGISSADDTDFSRALMPRLKITASGVRFRQNGEIKSKLREKLEWS